jgi:hypothetical protein
LATEIGVNDEKKVQRRRRTAGKLVSVERVGKELSKRKKGKKELSISNSG